MKKEMIIAGIIGLGIIPNAKADLFQCNACPVGHKCDGVNKTICPAGTYAEIGASICTDCQAGTYQQYSGQASCNACGVGQTSEAKATSCTDCSNKPANSHYTKANSCDWSCDDGYSSHGDICCQNGYVKSKSGKCCPATKKVTTYSVSFRGGDHVTGCPLQDIVEDSSTLLKFGKCVKTALSIDKEKCMVKDGDICYNDCD